MLVTVLPGHAGLSEMLVTVLVTQGCQMFVTVLVTQGGLRCL